MESDRMFSTTATQNAEAAKSAVGASLNSLAKATRQMQELSNEFMTMTLDSFHHNAETFEKLRSARSIEEFFRIESEYVRGALDNLASHSGKIAEIVSTIPKEMTSNAMDMARTSAETMRSAAERTGRAVNHAADAA